MMFHQPHHQKLVSLGKYHYQIKAVEASMILKGHTEIKKLCDKIEADLSAFGWLVFFQYHQ